MASRKWPRTRPSFGIPPRGDVSNHELKLITFSHALSTPEDLQGQDALLIDISDDMGEVLRLLDVANMRGLSLPPLIAICPATKASEPWTTHGR